MTHVRVDFALLAIEQLVNEAAKWHYMFGGHIRVPLVVRMLIGRGWGQGPQHSQSLQAWFAHVPGLKVVMPSTPYDAKGLLIASVEDDNPVIFFEHRWLHTIVGAVPEGLYRVPLGRARVIRSGSDLTIVATSYMTLEAIRAADLLTCQGISAEVIDLRTVQPLDDATILESVSRTGRLMTVDTSWKSFGVGAEIIARVTEAALDRLKAPPRRVALPDSPTPTTRALADVYYPRAGEIVDAARGMLGRSPAVTDAQVDPRIPLDVPDPSFTGPF